MRRSIIATRYRLRLLPVVVIAVFAATGIPIELRGAIWWDGGFDYGDIAVNVLLYVPLGIALLNRPIWITACVALALSGAIEIAQLWSVERYASPIDVATNVGGAILGALVARHWIPQDHSVAVTWPITGRWLVAAALGIATILAAWSLPTHSSALSNWKPEFPLVFGNEATGDRPWRGEIFEWALWPSVSTEQHADARTRLTDSMGSDQPLNLGSDRVTIRASPVTRAFAHAAMRNNAFTVKVRIVTADETQDGPARIVSFSTDPFNRNFDLGQEGRRFVFRVRTPVSGANGQDHRAESTPILRARSPTTIVASYDGRVSRIYVDGRLEGRSNLAAAGCRISSLCDSAVPIAWTLLGALIAVVALAVIPWRRRSRALWIALLAGTATLAIARLLQAGDVTIASPHWVQFLTILGAMAIWAGAEPASEASLPSGASICTL